MKICYECDNTKIRNDGRRGGYNHKDCRDGKRSRTGKIQKCNCWCRGSDKYRVHLTKLKVVDDE